MLKKLYEELIVPLKKGLVKAGKMKVEEFEKDEDENFHVDFIFSLANLRA